MADGNRGDERAVQSDSESRSPSAPFRSSTTSTVSRREPPPFERGTVGRSGDGPRGVELNSTSPAATVRRTTSLSSSRGAAISARGLLPTGALDERRPSAFGGAGPSSEGHDSGGGRREWERMNSASSDELTQQHRSARTRATTQPADSGSRAGPVAVDQDLTSAFSQSQSSLLSRQQSQSRQQSSRSSSVASENAETRSPSPSPLPHPAPALPSSASSQTLTSQPSFIRSRATPTPPPIAAPALTASHSSTSSTNARASGPTVAPPPSTTSSTTVAATLVPPAARTHTPSSTPVPSSRRAEPQLPSARVLPAPPTAMYWSRMPMGGRLPRGMRAHSATVVGSDIWCFGGCDIRGNCFKDVWKFDIDALMWTKPKVVGDVPPITRAHTAVLVDKRIFIIGGGDGPTYYNETYYFDTISLTWTKPPIFGPTPSRRRAHTAVLYEHQIIVFGGGNGAHALNDVHALNVSDVNHLEWRPVDVAGPKPTSRGYHTMNLVGSKCVVFGGSDGTECFSDVWILDLVRMRWSEVKPEVGSTAYPRLSHTSTCVGSYLFIIGGHDGVNFSSEILLFNLVTLAWETRNSYGAAPSARGYHATTLLDSRLVVIGGFDGASVYDSGFCLELGGSAFLPQITNFLITNPDDEG